MPSKSQSKWLRRTAISSAAITGSLLLGSIAVSGAQTVTDSVNEDVRVDAGADVEAKDFFGQAIAVDGNTMIVGAPEDDEVSTNAGAAYVFVKSGDAWMLEAKLLPQVAPALFDDLFGSSVAIDGDIAVVGAPIAKNVEPRSGGAHVFVRSNGTWTHQQFLGANDFASNESFGESVAISGTNFIVGAPTDGSGPGSAYVFAQSGASWVQQDKLVAADGAVGDDFGADVDIDGTTAIVGAERADIAGSNEGAAYIFTQNGTDWVEQTKLVASDAQDADRFGRSVALDGAVAVVGAPWADSVTITAPDPTIADDGTEAGVAYVFAGSGASWSETAILVASDEAGTDNFGSDVDVEGGQIVVGAAGDSSLFGSAEGSVFSFQNSGDGWVEATKFTASDGQGSDQLGTTVALSGTIIVSGAPNVDIDVDNQDSGAAYVFNTTGVQAPATPPTTAAPVTTTTEAPETTTTITTTAPPAPTPTPTPTPTPEPTTPMCGNLPVTVNLNLGEVPTAGDDVILGTPNDDMIVAGLGHDVICGEGGNDTIIAGDGQDVIYGGDGNDIIEAGQGKDTVYGQDGDDVIAGGKGKDTIRGGAGNDAIRGNEGTDLIYGGAGDDNLRGGQKADTVYGGGGNDTLIGGTRPDILDGGQGVDTYNGGGGLDTCSVDAALNESATACEL